MKKLIGQIFDREDWVEAGQNWKGRIDELRLSGWSRARRVVVLRRPLANKPSVEAELPGKKKTRRKPSKQLTLDLPEINYRVVQYEYVVLVTSLTDEVLSVAQHYRDRGDAENNFDELKNQWGWAGFTTQDRKRCQVMGRIIAVIYNWWTIFMRLGIDPGQTRRGDHLAASCSTGDCQADAPRQSDHGGDYELALQSRADR